MGLQVPEEDTLGINLVIGVGIDMSNIDQEEPCPECGEVMILDGEARICYECWSNLMVAEAEEEE